MKTKGFNKLSGTEFRVRKLTLAYLRIFLWIKDNYDPNLQLTSDQWDYKFKDWCLENDIYKYNNKKKINRFEMIRNTLYKLGFIKNNDKEKFEFNELIVDKISEENINIVELIENEITFQPFKQLISLIKQMQDSSPIKAKEAFLAFSIWEEGESFQMLYEKICKEGLEETLKNISLRNTDNTKKDNFNFGKTPKSSNKIKTIYDKIKIIYYKLKNNQILSSEDAELFKDKHLKDIWKTPDDLKNLTTESFEEKLEFFRIKKLLLKEYFDVFCRWMKEFGYYDKTNKVEILRKKTEYNSLSYPFTIENVEQYLNQINKRDFTFKKKNKILEDVPNYTLAEYFVNLFFAYYFSIEPADFQKYSRTIVNNQDLTPISPAPGKGADFRYYDKKTKVLYFIETTIHNSENAIINNESFPIANHIKQGLEKSINDYSIKLFVVSHLDKLNENHLFAHCNLKKEAHEFDDKYFESEYLKFKELDKTKNY